MNISDNINEIHDSFKHIYQVKVIIYFKIEIANVSTFFFWCKGTLSPGVCFGRKWARYTLLEEKYITPQRVLFTNTIHIVTDTVS